MQQNQEKNFSSDQMVVIQATLQNYSVTQIFREIKVGECKVSEFTLLAHLETLNFDYSLLHMLNLIYEINKLQERQLLDF